MAEQLTPQQEQAVENRGGRLLVSAAAGSGKTKVLVDRLLGYLTDPVEPANIDQFLMITYTKAAAAELRGKIAAKLNERVAQNPDNRHLQRQLQRLYLTKISTVHAFCGDILREYAYQLNLPGDFRVADENECREIRLQVMEKLLEDAYNNLDQYPGFREFVDTQGLGRDDRQVPEIVMQVYDSARCHLDPHGWLAFCREMMENEEVEDASQTIYGQFLMERLHQWLDLQIDVLQRCVDRAQREGICLKAAALIESTVLQLSSLRESENWEEVRSRSAIDFGRFPKSDGTDLHEKMKAVREACKKGFAKQLLPFTDSSQQLLQELRANARPVQGLLSLVAAFEKAFDQAKLNRKVLDFGDLEHKTLDLLLGKGRTTPTTAAREIASRFREVMVDEYQDSNAVQDAIYDAITREKKNLFMVGDVKQSIYQFRLADPGIFLKKYRSFKPVDEAATGEDRKVVLSYNFRSSAGVLEGCNDVFRLCMSHAVGGLGYGADEALYEGITHKPLGVPEVELDCVEAGEEAYPEEAAFVADHIRRLLKEGRVRDGEEFRPVKPEDIAILLRSPGSAGIHFQRALDQVSIRYATGGGVDLLQTREVGTLHALLQVIHNPRLDIPLVATLTSPIFGFTADDLAGIRSRDKKSALFDVLLQDEGEKAKTFVKTLTLFRSTMGRYSLSRLLEQVLVETAFEEIYGAMEDAQVRLSNIRSFYQLAADFEAGGNRDLGRFLEYLESMAESGLITAGDQSAAGCVTIMSIHKSKGLEFPVVYLCNLGRDFNMQSMRADVLCHKEMGLGFRAVDHENRLRYPTIAHRAIAGKMQMETVSEELRVLYVAMTRAKDRLIMTYSSKRLGSELENIVQRMDVDNGRVLIQEATCPGDWVLLTALQKTEAGALFALGGKPEETNSCPHTWKIQVVKAPQLEVAGGEIEENTVSAGVIREIREGLAFSYPYLAATVTPSKQTATGLKGRQKDEEAAENTAAPKVLHRNWRQPTFAKKLLQGRDYGNAIHSVMQYIDYSACKDFRGVKAEMQRLTDRQLISDEQARMVRAEKLYAFFKSDMGQKLMHGNVVREFKFSILEDGTAFDPSLKQERVLLQGVVDCALLEDDGITILDFKTDFVTDDSLAERVERYTAQVQAYACAMSRIYGKPVKQKLLYFFHLDRFVCV